MSAARRRAPPTAPWKSETFLTDLTRELGYLLAESATLVHENERRWRVFTERIRDLQSVAG